MPLKWRVLFLPKGAKVAYDPDRIVRSARRYGDR
jgi:hypothetical protein